MGCWNETCALTGLPILYGDKVAVLFLYENNIRDNSSEATRYFYAAPMMVYGKYDDYGGAEKCKGTQENFLFKALKESLLDSKGLSKLEDYFELKKESHGDGIKMQAPGIFKDYLKDPRTPHPRLYNTLILESTLNKFLEGYTWESYNAETRDYDKISYQSYLDSIDEYYAICEEFFKTASLLDHLPGHRQLKNNLVGHAVRSYREHDGGIFFMHEFTETLKEYVTNKDKDGFREFLTEFSKYAIMRVFMRKSRRPYIVNPSGTQDSSTDSQRFIAQVTLEIGREIDRHFEE